MLRQAIRGLVKELSRKDLSETRGVVGTEIFSGYITAEDDNTDWQGQQRALTIDKMRRTDVRIRQSEMIIKLPILAATMRIEPASDDNADIKIAEFIEANLFDNPYFRWSDFMRHLLLYLPYGHEVIEKTYIPHEGKLWLHKLEHRKHSTYFTWHVENGQLTSIEQTAITSEDASDARPMDARQIIHIAHEQEGNNFEGFSILRPAWVNWKAKQQLIRGDLVKHQRFGSGIPHVEVNRKNSISDARSAVEKLAANEQAYLISTDEYKMNIFGGGGQQAGTDAIKSIEFHDMQILFNVTGNFMAQGENKVGSFSLGKIKSDFFFMAEEAQANHIEDTLNEPNSLMSFIPDLVDQNFLNVKKYPKLRIEKLELDNLDGLAERLDKYVKSGLVQPDEELRKWIRELEELPEEAEVEPTLDKIDSKRPYVINSYQYKKQGNLLKLNTINAANDIIEFQKKNRRGPNVTPELLAFEHNIMNLAEIDNGFKRAREETKEIVRSFRNVIVSDLVHRGANILQRAKTVKQVVELLDKTIISNKTQLVNALVRHSKERFKFGRKTVKDEFAKQKKETQSQGQIIDDIDEAFKSIRPTTELVTNTFLTKIRTEWQNEVLKQHKSGQISTPAMVDSLNKVSTEVFNNEVSKIDTEAFGMGRNAELKRQGAKKFVRSEVFDQATCEPCINIDGVEFDIDSPDFAAVSRGPFNGCLGGDLCRGLNIGFI